MNRFHWDENFINTMLNNIIHSSKLTENIPVNNLSNEVERSLNVYYNLKEVINQKAQKCSLDEKQTVSSKKRININKEYVDAFVASMQYEKDKNPFYFSIKIRTLLDSVANSIIVSEEDMAFLNVNKKQALSTTHQFYKDLDADLFKALLRIEEINPYPYQFNKHCDASGICFFDTFNKIPYILVEETKSITDAYILVHEQTHAIAYCHNNGQLPIATITDEAFSLFMEAILGEYLYQERELYKNGQSISLSRYNSKIYEAQNALLQLKLFDFFQQKKGNDIETLKAEVSNFSLEEVSNLLSNKGRFNYIDMVTYIFSYVIASELACQFLDSPKEVLKNIKKLLLGHNIAGNLKEFCNILKIDFECLDAKNLEEQQKTLIFK